MKISSPIKRGKTEDCKVPGHNFSQHLKVDQPISECGRLAEKKSLNSI